MASLEIHDSDIPSLAGKVAIVTGGSSGIGLATAKLLAEKGATVHILDVQPPPADADASDDASSSAAGGAGGAIHYQRCDVSVWEDIRAAFDAAGRIDYVFPNAGISGGEAGHDYFADETDAEGRLLPPRDRVVDVNLRGALHAVKLAWSRMRAQRRAGEQGVPYGIVLTLSIAAYVPEQVFPVYTATKEALLGIIRSLRTLMIRDGITINGVAPGATLTGIGPKYVMDILAAAPRREALVGDARTVGRALVYSAVASEGRAVQVFGRQAEAEVWRPGRWNGRVILVLGRRYAELEEPIADLRPFWFGRENLALLREQQAILDFRE
ncbi:hypothetical protein F4802DRAFT_584793 [Xylaria palmicola]|nr:hypothetical protein F4802DRAFT_584793 [Xylaria palmicola]